MSFSAIVCSLRSIPIYRRISRISSFMMGEYNLVYCSDLGKKDSFLLFSISTKTIFKQCTKMLPKTNVQNSADKGWYIERHRTR
jgi:hypothetical protein